MKYPIFTKEMKNSHTLLLPNFAPIHMKFIEATLRQQDYKAVLLENTGHGVMECGLKYVNNDSCYPAILIIGQFLDALRSGQYDLNRTALVVTKTGGGCRASNYMYLLRKALQMSGFERVIVATLNFSGVEAEGGIEFSATLGQKMMAAVFYADLLQTLKGQTLPYEKETGTTFAKFDKWQKEIYAHLLENKGFSGKELKVNIKEITKDFSKVLRHSTPKVKVGVVGELYVKYCPMGNNNLEDFLIQENCEVNIPCMIAFLQYVLNNTVETVNLYGGSLFEKGIAECMLLYIAGIEKVLINSLNDNGYHAHLPFEELKECVSGIMSRGNKMGEGWLLTAEMVALVQNGYENVICAQPFGCLPNHICGKGMMGRIRELYPNSNITTIDYDASSTRVNQENRIRLMLAIGNDKLKSQLQQQYQIQQHQQEQIQQQSQPQLVQIKAN